MEEKKKNNAATLEQVKKEYQKPCMTQEQVEQMKQRIEEAKAEKQKKAANSYMGRKIAAAAAVVVAAFIVLPNTSEECGTCNESDSCVRRSGRSSYFSGL